MMHKTAMTYRFFKHLYWFFAWFLMLLGCSGFAPGNQPSQDQMKKLGIHLNLDKRVLSNGLTVIMVEDHTVPVVSYQTWFKVGSVDERPGLTGISHLFEHLMFKGTPKYGPKQFFQQLETHGAEVNAFTTRDYTVYYETFSPHLLDKVIEMESDRMGNLILNDEVLNHERLVVLEERRLRTENSPEGKMQEALWQLAFRLHPYHWPVIGFPADLLNMTAADLQKYYKTYYQPGNAAVIVVGDFNSEKTLAQIRKAYEKIAHEPRPPRKIQAEPVQTEERRLVIRDRVASEKFVQAYHITAAENEESYAIDVLSNILFEGATSRAYIRLVEEEDIMIGIAGSSYTPTYPGLLMVSGTMKGNVPASKAEALLDKIIREVQDHGVKEEEVRTAVKQLTVQLVDSVRTPYGLGQMIGTVQTILGDPKRFVSDLAKYTQVKAEDVQKVAKKYLHPNNRSVVNLMPTQ